MFHFVLTIELPSRSFQNINITLNDIAVHICAKNGQRPEAATIVNKRQLRIQLT